MKSEENDRDKWEIEQIYGRTLHDANPNADQMQM